jgi:hypothetical protein
MPLCTTRFLKMTSDPTKQDHDHQVTSNRFLNPFAIGLFRTRCLGWGDERFLVVQHKKR